MNRDYRQTLLSGNPFSREHRHALVESLGDSSGGGLSPSPTQTILPVLPVQFLATITASTAILTNRVWKYAWTQIAPDPNLSAGSRTSTQTVSGSANAYFNFALNGAELNNPAQSVSNGIVAEARATFGVKTGVVSATGSTVTLLPLNEGPNPVVLMTVFPDPIVVAIGGSNYSCSHWMSAANQVDVTCG
jgi:hypothetical protein